MQNHVDTSFEALTKAILEKEQQIKQMAEQVAQHRANVLTQIVSAMGSLNISTDDLIARMGEGKVAESATTSSEQASATLETSPETTQAAAEVVTTGVIAQEDASTQVSEAQSQDGKDLLGDVPANDASTDTEATKESAPAPTTTTKGSTRSTKFGSFGGAKAAA